MESSVQMNLPMTVNAGDSTPMMSLPQTVTHAEIIAQNKLLWEQPGGSPPEMEPG